MEYVAYLRVSTNKQGLGLEAQATAVNDYIIKNNGNLVATFLEKKSGKKADREELRKAIALAKEHSATLVVAKLDRLSREVDFLFILKKELDEAGVSIVACDLPELNTLTLGIFATMAQHERELISKRTKEALAVRKSQGVKLGRPMKQRPQNTGQLSMLKQDRMTKEKQRKGNRASVTSKKRRAVERARPLFKHIQAYIVSTGITSLTRIARYLNDAGFKSVGGGIWTATSVKRILALENAIKTELT